MENEKFHDSQAEAFIDYAGKSSCDEWYQLFINWAKSKDIFDVDREIIWGLVRNCMPSRKAKTIADMDDDCIRISAVLDLLLYGDQMRLEGILQQQGETEK